MKNLHREGLAPQVVISLILVIFLSIITFKANAQETAEISITPQGTRVVVTYDNADISKAVKLVVDKAIKSRKISSLKVFDRTYKVMPYIDGKITYVLYIDNREVFKSTRISDIRKKIIEYIKNENV